MAERGKRILQMSLERHKAVEIDSKRSALIPANQPLQQPSTMFDAMTREQIASSSDDEELENILELNDDLTVCVEGPAPTMRVVEELVCNTQTVSGNSPSDLDDPKDQDYNVEDDAMNSSDSEHNLTFPNNIGNENNSEEGMLPDRGPHAQQSASKETLVSEPQLVKSRPNKPRQKRKTLPPTYAATHPLGPPCKVECKLKCLKKIDEARRLTIWNDYTSKVYKDRKTFLHAYIERKNKGRSTTNQESRRKMTYKYLFSEENGSRIQVCKTFFLTTLGYNVKNDQCITTLMETTSVNDVSPKPDQRGKHKRPNKLDATVVMQHVESFNPCISHYRRAHAPNRRYLPSDITKKFMYDDFRETHPNFQCSYEYYREVIVGMKISFTKLGEEQCETCVEFHTNAHMHNHDAALPHATEADQLQASKRDKGSEDAVTVDATEKNPATSGVTLHHELTEMHDERSASMTLVTEVEQESIGPRGKRDTLPDCTICKQWNKHMERSKTSRTHYRCDAEKVRSADTIIRSVDLQKVIMLPRMPGIKTACFTKRLIAFHLTFASLGKKKVSNEQNIAVVWHEGVAGRKGEEIVSAYIRALLEERDVCHIIYWVDNCSGQNKNWILFTSLVTYVNLDNNETKDLTLNYFEPGHTFMSADSVHHGVELEMSRQPHGSVYDFKHFEKVVKSSNGCNMNVLTLVNDDVRAWKGRQSQARLKVKGRPMMADLAAVQFRRGSQLLYYKTDHDEKEFKEFSFLVRTYTTAFPALLRPVNRGLPTAKKNDIITKMCPLMPQSARQFWRDLREDAVPDLVFDGEEME